MTDFLLIVLALGSIALLALWVDEWTNEL